VPDPRSAPARSPHRASAQGREREYNRAHGMPCLGCHGEVHGIHTSTSPSLQMLESSTPGSSCPLPSEPAQASPACCCCLALPLLPDPPSPPPAPSRCLLPVLAISLFCGGCVDTLQKPPTAPTPPQAVSPRSHDHHHVGALCPNEHIWEYGICTGLSGLMIHFWVSCTRLSPD